MDDNNQRKPLGSPPTDSRGHPRPRRTSPEQSVTLQHHRHALDVAARSTLAKTGAPDLDGARQNSSDDSHDTARNTARNTKTWFDQSNRNNDKNNFDSSMDVDPPFYQKETESSTGEPPPYPFEAGAQVPFLRPGATQSSSADDYRSVIDDLTIENKRLKEELKRYRQFGPDMMRKEKLFELKVHGLPKRKKRELEATLRDFAASLEGSSESPPPHKKQARRGLLDYAGNSNSKHASSSSSRSRPVDSAYASMSTGPSSNAHNSSHMAGRPTGDRTRRSTEQKVEDYLRETPGGLFPRHVVMTDKDKKKTVVRRLEQLFTGKMGRKALSQLQVGQPGDPKIASEPSLPMLLMAPPPNTEAVREARIQPIDPSGRKPRSRDNVSTSNSNGDHTDSGGHPVEGGDGTTVAVRMGNITSPSTVQPPEQRPTRPKDLDPDRAQVPSENMDYIRHLGIVQPGFTVRAERSYENVSPDADGWVYLNLLCNLAQLHIFNVTPNFIRAAVTEKSTKFQLSADGRKIRWRGGTDGTKFSSDSSGDNSQRSGSGEDSDGTDASGQRKRAKMQQGSATWGSDPSGQHTGSSDSFHYKPLFVRHSSSIETSLEGTGSQASDALADDSNMGNSKWDYSGSGSSQRKKRRVDGAIVYYSGAPFCIDLSGDPGDVSPGGLRASAGQQLSEESEETDSPLRPVGHRTLSGSSLPIRPTSEAKAVASDTSDSDSDSDDTPDLVDDSNSAATEELEFPWCDDPQEFHLRPDDSTLEACGLGGVLPEDHFAIVVATKRPIVSQNMGPPTLPPRPRPKDSITTVLDRLRMARTASPNRLPAMVGKGQPIAIEEMGMKIWRLRPMPLPPAAMFFDPYSSDTDSEFSEEDSDDDDDDAVLQRHAILAPTLSQRANPHLSSSSEDEDGGSVEEVRQSVAKLVSGDVLSEEVRLHPPTIPRTGTGKVSELLHEGSSVATAGGAESGYSSSMEEDAA